MLTLKDLKGIKPLPALLVAQFLSAFVDNMILFITLAILKGNSYPGYYLPLVQSAFLLSYIVLAPWVGRIADKHSKAKVLILGNIIKSFGILMLIFDVNPVLCYAVVGTGAVVYSPAKYGILPELAEDEGKLLKANSKIESFTILAILCGSVVGGILSDISIMVSLLICLLLYSLSICFNLLIPAKEGDFSITYNRAVREFRNDSLSLLSNPQGLFTLVGTGTFWLASAVLRLIIIAWLPITLASAQIPP
ncbi:hypothetical protein N752_06805 [Desulforamulus aquiferis]|nr:MFS transporter [Desulforamulus aquiferis]RYD05949.1 hypothetical protein N752_06805 [Desulforamulus aquiferis]